MSKLEELLDYGSFLSRPLIFKGLYFVLTCHACPEQYDVWDIEKDTQVGYVRLRWGRLRADTPDVGGRTVFYHEFEGGHKGIFKDDEERTEFLIKIAVELNKVDCSHEPAVTRLS